MDRRTWTPFQKGLAASLALHGGVFLLLNHRAGDGGGAPLWATADAIEVDLTRPFRLTADPRLARLSANPGTGAPIVDKPTPGPSLPGGGVAAKGVEWTAPGPKTTALTTPEIEGNLLSTSTGPSTGTGLVEGPSQGLGGLGTGGEGEVDWVYLTELPKLLNREEMARNIRRFYPEEERRAGHEGQVVARIHLNREGRVSSLDVERSAGTAFDAAAQKVLALAQFSPAKAGDRAVAVKIRQAVAFRLED